MQRFVSDWRSALLAIAMVIGAGLVPLNAQEYGLDTRPAIGAFLNQTIPPREQGAAGWQTVVAFPNLSFTNPVAIVSEPGTNRIYVCQREGAIYFFTNNPATTSKVLFLNLTAKTQVYDDSGCLGMAFHPQFNVPGSTNRYVYVYYQFSPAPVPGTSPNTPGYNRLSRFTVPNGSLVADPASEVVLINQFDRNTWHNGGGIFFGPDGFLYLSNGDEGSADDVFNNAQKINLGLFSGLVRIDVDRDPTRSHPIRRQPSSAVAPPAGWPPNFTSNYYIPNDNPWLDTNGMVLEEFYAIGLRSPHRVTCDPVTGRIWAGDVGQGTVEEVNLIEKGGNYQWSYLEGTLSGFRPRPNPLIGVDKPPVYEYLHANGNNCIIGGYVYRGVEHAAFLNGKYIFGDNGSGRIWAMTYQGGSAQVELLCTFSGGEGPSSFGVDQAGELYLCRMGNNTRIYKLARIGAPVAAPPPLLSQTGVFTNLASLGPNAGLLPFAVNSPLWSDGAVKSRWMAVPNNGAPYTANEQISFSVNGSWSFPTGTVLVKHFELPVNDTNAAIRKRLETRFLVRGTNGFWFGYTYKWRDDNSDADLLAAELNETNLIITPTGVRTQVWYYPSSQDCIICHNQNSGQVLGLSTRQLNGDFTYPSTGRTDNQLRALGHIGVFNSTLNETNIPTYPRLAAVTDTNAPLVHRVRSYLDANCAQCHRPNGVHAFFDARFNTPLENQGIVGGAVANTLGIPDAKVVAPTNVAQSIMHLRMNSTGQIRMPPLARNVVDTEAVAVLAQWINTLTPVEGGLPPPWNHQDIGSVGLVGNATYNAGAFTLVASGVDIWDNADGFHFAYRPLTGNAVITARITSLANTDPWAVTGVMIRQNLTAGSPHALMGITSENGLSFVTRRVANGGSFFVGGPLVAPPRWVRLVRSGNTLTGFQSADGVVWTQVGSDTVSMAGTIFVGLALSSHNNIQLGSATFDNVLVTGPGVNNPPVIELINPSLATQEDTSSGLLAFTIGDVETPASALTLSATSSVPSLVANDQIFFGGSGSNRTVSVSPADNQYGSAEILLAVSDGTNSATAAFQLTVQPVNDAPTALPDLFTRWMTQGIQRPATSLLTNDTDIDGDPLNLDSVSGTGAAGGTITLSNEWVRYWPVFGNTNGDSFNYVISDGQGGFATGVVTVVVVPDPAGSDLLAITREAASGYEVRLSGIPGFTYTVQYSDGLTPPVWHNLATVVADETGLIQIIDVPPDGKAVRFYRTVRGVVPP